MRNACMVGWSHSPFGRLDDQGIESLITDVARKAIADAGISARDVDAIVLGHFNAGFVPDAFTSSMVLQADPDLRFKPATRLENACASGAAALYHGLDLVDAGRAKYVLVVGAEKMTALPGKDVTNVLAHAGYVPEETVNGLTFPGIFATIAQAYFERYGEHSSTLAKIAAKNHANGVRNPYAQMRKDLGFDFCNSVSEKNPIIAAPLRKTDCSLVSDGAAAIVLAASDIARHHKKAIAFRSTVQVNDYLPLSKRDTCGFEGPTKAWRDALAAARINVNDLDFAEVHDCFTIAELLAYEAMGLAKPGQGARAVEEGTVYPGGDLPVNASGGLKAKGHPIGATGVSMHVISAMQLTGTAGEFQIPDAQLAGVFNMGGSAVANYVSILEPFRA